MKFILNINNEHAQDYSWEEVINSFQGGPGRHKGGNMKMFDIDKEEE